MKKVFLLLTLGLLVSTSIVAQESTGELDKYARNSLSSMMIYHPEDAMAPYIYTEFDSIPIPDKYDDHNFGFRVVVNDSIKGVQKKKAGLIKAQYGKSLTASDIRKNAEALETLLNNAQCGKIMVAKWFNMDVVDNTGIPVFNTQLIQERGQYNASDIDVEQAMLTTRGVAALSDAGEELIGNTYMLVNDITYVTAEERAAAAKVALAVIGGLLDAFTGGSSGRDLAKTGGQIADAFTGFTVKTHSYLFQLEWNDSIAAIFYNNYYSSTPNMEKIQAFMADNSTFKVKYVAHEYEYDGKTELKGKYERSELVKMVCTRSLDKNIAALQLQYEDFKVKTPIYEVLTDEKGRVTGYTAKIGMKEGVTENTKFLVLQRRLDPETNRTTYRRIATLKPEKGQIWDNRYNAVIEGDEGSELTATTFKKVSGGEILPGMLIIEGNYRKATE